VALVVEGVALVVEGVALVVEGVASYNYMYDIKFSLQTN
jgi:hypothetical protein